MRAVISGYRYYSAELGRWMNRDPLKEVGSIYLRITSGNEFTVPSQSYDKETGLNYKYHRYYDPGTGRYLNPDPLGIREGLNLFLYTGNNPINAIDPNGLTSIIITVDPELIELPLRPPRPKYTGPNPCDGYSDTLGSKCCRNGKRIDDPYPSKAQDVCNRFMDDFNYSSSSMCVAKCLIAEEKIIQKEYTSCQERNAERIRAHMRCYDSCNFYLEAAWIGLPDGGLEVGAGMLLPDYIKDFLGIDNSGCE